MIICPTPLNPGLKIRIPPKMVHIDGHSDMVRINHLSHIVGLPDGIDGRTVAGIHRMQRFNGQFDPCTFRRRQYFQNSLSNLLPAFFQRLASVCPANQYNHWCANCCSLFDGQQVVIYGSCPFTGIHGREKTAACK